MIKRRPSNQPVLRPMLSTTSKDSSPHKSPTYLGFAVPRIVIKDSEDNASEEYQTLPYRKNWSALVLTLAYFNELLQRKEQLNSLLSKLDSGAVNLLCCHPNSIPHSLKQLYTASKLLELVRLGLETAGDFTTSTNRLS